ncbi:histidine phosphatase family protein [Marisediminicola sp. LYQ134]|uniref:histidine phosphatase family protein n=1 Tax=unclassified Marisediminicola TaxID=2618316 RepID=UPI003983C2B3
MKIALTRHGQTEWNRTGRLQGVSDIPLNDTGRAQAVASAERFDGGEWVAVVSSPLSRAAETARIIAAGAGLDYRGSYPDLVERDYGDAEGMTLADAAVAWPDLDYPRLEPRESVAARGLAAIEAIAADVAAEPGAGDAIVVAHGTLIREVLRRLSGAEVPPILNAASSVIERTETGWHVVSINDGPPA